MSWDQAATNFHRAAAAGIDNAFWAGEALHKLGDECPERWKLVAEARIDRPVAPWSEIAEGLGMTKFQAASCFRRLLLTAGVGPERLARDRADLA